MYAEFRKYPIKWKNNNRIPLKIHNSSNKGVQLEGGCGFFISSNRDGGKDFKNPESIAKFYLGRILLNVIASKSIHLPVEILDISVEYKNDDLQIAWDSHSEYHIQFENFDFRVISPTALYVDWSKCVYNARSCPENTRKQRKINKRLERLHKLLDKLIIPYKNTNTIMRQNLARNHTQSHTFVRNTMKNLHARTLYIEERVNLDNKEGTTA
jgi:hypothetical protein